MYVCIYVYMYVRTYLYTHTHASARARAHTHIHIHTHIYIHIYISNDSGGRASVCAVIVSVIVRKKVHLNVCLNLNGYPDIAVRARTAHTYIFVCVYGIGLK